MSPFRENLWTEGRTKETKEKRISLENQLKNIFAAA